MSQAQLGLVDALEMELSNIGQRQQILEKYRTTLQSTLEMYKMQGGLSPLFKPAAEPVKVKAVKKAAPAPIHRARTVKTKTAAVANSAPSTLDMTRTILQNAGGYALKLEEIKAAIKATYGLEPAKSLDQMLYKRSQQEKGFYKTPEGKFGLVDLRPVINKVNVPSAA